MRQLKITQRPQADGPENMAILVLWASLGSGDLSPEALPLQPWFEKNARFIASVVMQYINQGVSTEALVAAAHETLVTLLNQYAHRLDKLGKVFALALHNAMVTAVQAQTGSSR